jgi:hypothetical protein
LGSHFLAASDIGAWFRNLPPTAVSIGATGSGQWVFFSYNQDAAKEKATQPLQCVFKDSLKRGFSLSKILQTLVVKVALSDFCSQCEGLLVA